MADNNANYKNVRISPEVYQLLKEIRFHTDENFIDITNKSIVELHKRMVREGIIKK